jgi:hypothetical protein
MKEMTILTTKDLFYDKKLKKWWKWPKISIITLAAGHFSGKTEIQKNGDLADQVLRLESGVALLHEVGDRRQVATGGWQVQRGQRVPDGGF